eukprot:gnl/Spiro4/2904_TR1432_c0_g1_i1.p1 gnl/Spiro4/2904_TR1432_c0_g1~~gnl/Spiro4/2904_TR1432_c0_g1_i1.p1  ORF type:complete len:326 (+),score=96.90 gnl/Spiro4/2904_TR1432_c0_g1_i1:32-979(+)
MRLLAAALLVLLSLELSSCAHTHDAGERLLPAGPLPPATQSPGHYNVDLAVPSYTNLCRKPCTHRCVTCGYVVPWMRTKFEEQGYHMTSEFIPDPRPFAGGDPDFWELNQPENPEFERLGHIYAFLDKSGDDSARSWGTSMMSGSLWRWRPQGEPGVDHLQPTVRNGMAIFDLMSTAPQHSAYMLLDALCRASETYKIDYVDTSTHLALPRQVGSVYESHIRFFESMGFSQDKVYPQSMRASVNTLFAIGAKNQRPPNGIAVFHDMPPVKQFRNMFNHGSTYPHECEAECALPGDPNSCPLASPDTYSQKGGWLL